MKSDVLKKVVVAAGVFSIAILGAACGDDDTGGSSAEAGGTYGDVGVGDDTGGGGGGYTDTGSYGGGGEDTGGSAWADTGSPGHYDAGGGAAYDAGSYADAGGSEDVGAPPPDAGEDTSGETYEDWAENDFENTADDALATFSVDVDTASYTIMRRDVLLGRLPQQASVRVEEYLNFFDYGYEAPTPDAAEPFAIHLESAPSMFGDGLEMLRIGIQGMEVPAHERDPANLVFLIDVSGSMSSTNKLDLVKFSLQTLVKSLGPDDTLGIVVYAGRDAVLLEPTAVRNRAAIYEAIEGLSAGGGTAGEAGIRRAYSMAESAFRDDGINRVVLCTDGDFNVGLTGDSLLALIEDYRERDINITTLGFGMGNYNDHQMEQIADRGNGNYAYIDSRNEALRALGTHLVGTLQVIAKDVKIQVEFNAEVVERYRLVGYDNRVLEDWEFVDDTVDAAEIGAGHDVTAFLELDLVDDLAFGAGAEDLQLAEVRVRYKEPGGDVSTEVIRTFTVGEMGADLDEASDSLRFAMAVAEFAEILRDSRHSEGARFDDVLELATGGASDEQPDMFEFIELVETARDLWGDEGR